MTHSDPQTRAGAQVSEGAASPAEAHIPTENSNAQASESSANALVTEKALWHLHGSSAALTLLGLVLVTAGSIALVPYSISIGGKAAFWAIPAGLLFLIAIICATGFDIIQPGHTRVVQFFGKYIGTIRTDGLIFTYPLTVRHKLSVRIHNFETNELKINDEDGNPVTAAGIIVWTVGDTARATFAVTDYQAFIKTQAEAALRHVISTHPYDEGTRTEVVSLRGSTDVVSQELADEVAARVQSAGLTIIEARISSLSYAPEIAQAMLQRQQAAAVVAARGRIVEGAVSMVQDALQQLEHQGIVDLDEERRAAMVSNLLVVLCSDNHVSPVVNTGTLYN